MLDAHAPDDGNNGRIVSDWRLKVAGSSETAPVHYVGQCHHQAHLFNLGIEPIDLPAGREYRVRASADPVGLVFDDRGIVPEVKVGAQR